MLMAVECRKYMLVLRGSKFQSQGLEDTPYNYKSAVLIPLDPSKLCLVIKTLQLTSVTNAWVLVMSIIGVNMEAGSPVRKDEMRLD